MLFSMTTPSRSICINADVLQGSIFGPILFLIFTTALMTSPVHDSVSLLIRQVFAPLLIVTLMIFNLLLSGERNGLLI